MNKKEFITDMAADNLESQGISGLATRKSLSYGITETVLNVKNNEVAERINRPKGVYVTYDAAKELTERGEGYLSKLISATILQLFGNLQRNAVVLVVGLGNPSVTADSLGAKAVEMVNTTRGAYAVSAPKKQEVCTLTAGVAGATGIKSVEMITALTDKVKPSAVILVDTLATSSPKRIGSSFQLTTSGIAPGSGVGADKARIDKSVLGVPVVAIGVPLVLSMRTVIGGFSREFAKELGCQCDEFKLRAAISDAKLGNLVVSPKEIELYLNTSARIVANGINLAFS